jgi:hypothetical protein
MRDAPDPSAPRHLAACAPLLIHVWQRCRPVLWAFAVVFARLLLGAAKVLLALLIVFEEWGWRPLADLLGWLSRWRPWAAAEAFIVQLPPYAALVVFALPTLLLLPLKFLALLLIASNHLAAAGLLFIAAKLLATALIARLFLLTQPALMRIGWFASAHDRLMPWKRALIAQVHASWPWRFGRRCKRVLLSHCAAEWRRWRPVVLELLASVGKAAAELSLAGRDRFGAAWRWLGRAMSR